MTTIPIPLPFEKGRDRERELPPHLNNQFYNPASSPSFSSPAASSSSTPIPYHPTALPSKLNDQQSLEGADYHDNEDPSVGQEEEENIFRDMSWEEILEDLNARFLINLPREEMSLVRVYWQAEQAHWFYEDYLRPLNPLLPSLSQRNFTRIIIESSPLYASLMAQGGVDYDQVWEEYCSYKRMVPCCGGILINKDGDKCLMVRGYKSSAGWSFPRGKINLEESEEACAIREVEEETGFDLTGMIHPTDKIKTHINAQEVTMFIVKGIDENTVFKTQTRNEIGAIEWVRLADLPTWINKKGPKKTGGNGQKKFYNVTPFVTPLKQWLKGHGIDPYMKPKKKPQPAPYRDLQPYQFESPSPQPASPVPSRGTSALDHLFARFIHKQEEELSAPNQQAIVGSDNKAGLERLFGNLNVLKEEEESLPHRYDGISDQERQKKEDNELARLLGGVGIAQTPAPEPARPTPSTQKQSNLLAMLNARPSASTTHSHPQHPQSPASPAKPHQAKLLSMISAHPPDHGNNQTPSKPMSLPTSPRPPSPTEEAQRQAKARALLDMTLAGIGIDVPANSAHQIENMHAPHSDFLPPLPQPGSAGRTSNTSGSSGTRITPPGQMNMPPIHQPPPPTYTHNQGYRPNTQPPVGGYGPPRPPAGPINQSQGVFGGSPNRSSQPPPPPPYEAASHPQVRSATLDYPSYVGPVNPSHDQRPGVNMTMYQSGVNPARPPGLTNLQTSQSFRPTSNPLPGPGNYGFNYGNVPSNGPHHHVQGGFVPPHPNYPNHNQPYQPRPPMGVGVGVGVNGPLNQSNQGGYQPQPPFPPNMPPPHSVPNQQPQQQYGNQRGSPPKPQNMNNPNVFHPVPRPPQGQGAALLAMINNGNTQGR
ncbi:hypothetical protein I302_103841 [Kwoniella bestiolae CBS 10118]|uniref:Nudix hydrolase domain-containing protein n=1 Tax=Kwoniella bestiolae CBS 10118 TaxID=1296100 RepID=A0A1B9G9K3_9TREE|nr:hypothetical protein I302_02544 [Kwoniella bestiolae CBS 10118]OCF27699.1 hypothetical protein I302_02544 [Kwoniella bestiolae CBS 10118]